MNHNIIGKHRTRESVNMDEASVMISKSAIVAASEEFKLELAAMLGIALPQALATNQQAAERSKLADLSEPAARMFVAGCSSRTLRVLTLIVRRDGNFLLREVERSARAATTGLRAVWAGLTKRTRTVTGDPDAALIGWQQRGDDYEGWISPTTCASLKIALGL